MNFPQYRPRRLRKSALIRKMVRETELTASDLILPLFVIHGKSVRNPIASMPGHFQYSVDLIGKEAQSVWEAGVSAVILFGIPQEKDPIGKSAFDPEGPVPMAIKAIKESVPEMLVITDVCMCEYTSHGHCGIFKDGDVDNDSTLELLGRAALTHAEAGADMIAPSDMMDGRVGMIRKLLDRGGFSDIPIMSYAAKYSSAFYGPFRDAAESTPESGDRRGYQMDPANSNEAMREVALDIGEGADIVMVKPALPYLDIIRRVKDEFDYPVAAYNVSGEYSMVKAAAAKGWIDGEAVMMETLLSIKRAGADIIITYFAKEAALLLKKG
ncbi:Porphobilinogen synthase [hydrothermal vent metagenome]|uniref:Delta-aminolevulinic acid dehydratase n=1 Tax=hydrothermal vent metagenome TaxID=652676 RepID=A0A3B0RDQ7_9ZZZZ